MSKKIGEQRGRWGRRKTNNVSGDPWNSFPCVIWKLNENNSYVRRISVGDLQSLGLEGITSLGDSDYGILINDVLHIVEIHNNEIYGRAININNAKVYSFNCDTTNQDNNVIYEDTGKMSNPVLERIKKNQPNTNNVQYISSTPQAKQMQQTLATLSQRYSADESHNGFPSPGKIDGIVGKQTLTSFNSLFDYVRANYNTPSQSKPTSNPKVDSLEKINGIQPKEIQPQSLSEVEWIKQYPCVSTDQFELLQKNNIAIQVRNTITKKIYNLYQTGRFEEYVNNKLQRTGNFHCTDNGFQLNVVKK